MFKRLMTATALAATLAGPGAAFDIDAMTEAEREAFGAAVREYLLRDPQVIMDAVAELERLQAEQQAANDVHLLATHADALFNDPGDWVGGNPDGDITVVEFLDYNCGFCKRAHPAVAELLESDGNIRLVVKEFPILGPESMMASRFALAVRAVEGDAAYKDVNDTMMSMRGQPTEATLTHMADSKGYDTAAVLEAMNGGAVTEIIQRNRALGQVLAISGTPSFVFGSEFVRGFVPIETMREIIAEQRG